MSSHPQTLRLYCQKITQMKRHQTSFLLLLGSGDDTVSHSGHLNQSTTCKIDPSMNWEDLLTFDNVKYSYWMQWANLSNTLLNYTCTDSARKKMQHTH